MVITKLNGMKKGSTEKTTGQAVFDYTAKLLLLFGNYIEIFESWEV